MYFNVPFITYGLLFKREWISQFLVKCVSSVLISIFFLNLHFSYCLTPCVCQCCFLSSLKVYFLRRLPSTPLTLCELKCQSLVDPTLSSSFWKPVLSIQTEANIISLAFHSSCAFYLWSQLLTNSPHLLSHTQELRKNHKVTVCMQCVYISSGFFKKTVQIFEMY